MFLQNLISQRIDNNRPVKVALIGAGKFGSMFLCQVPTTPGLEVVIIAFPKDDITSNQLSNMIDALQNTWPRNDLAVLEDHPDELEQVDGFKLNFGKCCLLLIQPRSKLHEARAYLETKDYYKNWSQEYKKAVQSR